MMRISVCSFDDYERIVAFLLDNGGPITSCDPERLVITAEISEEFANRMYADAGIESEISIWETTPD
ncbi:MAG: hypothetical protein Q8L10_01115 [Candidatus Moranbacteria bacterium]|nr:hypothetical protein [Candidatus Moranbacteria bacterium]